MSKFFLQRPVFAFVVSIFIVLLGLVSMRHLPLEYYPKMVPPVVMVSAQFSGATAQTLADSVAAPLEQAINGVEDMLYMFSQSATPGCLNLKVYFAIGTDPEEALTRVQTRVNRALAFLPDEVQKTGVLVTKQFPDILLFIAVQDPYKIYDDIFVTNYASVQIVDEIQRLKGVSNAQVYNAQNYSIRIWLQPDRLAQLNLSTSDVIQAIRTQNAIRTIGEIGQEPTTANTKLTIPVSSLGRLKEPREFEQIILRANSDGSRVLLRDVSYVELGAESYSLIGKLNGEHGAFIAINQDYGANSIDVANRVKKKLEEISQFFPTGLTYTIPYDTTNFIKISIKELGQTLVEACLLVSLVIFLFLHSVRASLVPIIAMVISIIGTFTGLYFLHFSINTLTLFGMVLAVGIVVDDAIVVVENVERKMRTLGLSSKEAAKAAMEEVSGPVVAIVFVLCFVFIPVGFIGGIPGQFYKQFAITIAVSVVISGFVALTLCPVLAALLLKETKKLSSFANEFNRLFDRFTDIYLRGSEWIIKRPLLGGGICIGVLCAIFLLAKSTPLGFVPKEDEGLLMIAETLPDGASLKRVEEVSSKVREVLSRSPGVENNLTFSGFSLIESIQRTHTGTTYLSLTDWDKRKSKRLQIDAIQKSLAEELSLIPEAKISVLTPPSIPGIGVVGGYDFWIVNGGGADISVLNRVVKQIVEKGYTRPEFDFFITSIEPNCMELYLDLDVVKAKALGVRVEDVYQTLQVLLGSIYVNDFNKFGRVFQVIAQADPTYRDQITDIGTLFVRSDTDKMIPLNSLVVPRFSKGPTLVSRFNGTPAALISVIPKAASPDQVIATMEEIAKEFLEPGMSFSWGGIAFQQKTVGGASGAAVLGGLFMVFLVLAALYERWSLPLTILFAVPFGIFGAFLAIWLRGMTNDIYFQIGMVALIGLSAKNAILIVEFARVKRKEGMGAAEAALQAARLRFRAIVMTSLTLIFGTFPLVISSGAGSASRHSVGTGVIGGMFAATFLAVFFVPLFFRIMEELVDKMKKSAPPRPDEK